MIMTFRVRRQDVELQLEIGADDRSCAWTGRGNTQPTDDLLTGSESGRNRQRLSWTGHVYRGPTDLKQ